MEPNQAAERPPVCPECGAPLSDDLTHCWLCGWKAGEPSRPKAAASDASGANPYASPAPPNRADLKWTFSLSTLFLWTALVAVVMGVMRIAPGLGIALGILSFPAALHTIGIAAYRKRRTGHALTVQDKILAFIGSFAVFLLIAVAVVIAAISAAFLICMSKYTEISAPNPTFVIPAIATAAVVVFIGFGVYFLVQALWRTPKD